MSDTKYSCPELGVSVRGTGLMLDATLSELELVLQKGEFKFNETPVRGRLKLHLRFDDQVLAWIGGRTLPADASQLEQELVLDELRQGQRTASLRPWSEYLKERNTEKSNLLNKLEELE